jgi:DNA repair exonuclease SbcCD nuclease subunit
MRALAVGDLHAGAGSDLGREPGDRLREQERVWARALEIAREEECDVVLNAGDIFHRARPTPAEILAVERPLIEHREEGGPPVIGIIGNHEVSGTSTESVPMALGMAGLWTLHTLPSARRAPNGTSVCFLPWAPVSRIVAAHDGGDRDDVNQLASEMLLTIARHLRSEVDGPAILLTHFSISGSSLPNGLPVEQLREPVLELGELEALGFDAIVAGHIHSPQEFRDGVFYVGSPLPMNFGEAGTEHGVWILDLPGGARFVPIESRRLVTLPLLAHDILNGALTGGLLEDSGILEGVIIKARITATQEDARRLDIAGFKRALYELGVEKVWAVQLEIEKPERARVEGLTEELDELAALDLWIEAQSLNGSQAEALRERTEVYLGVVRA